MSLQLSCVCFNSLKHFLNKRRMIPVSCGVVINFVNEEERQDFDVRRLEPFLSVKMRFYRPTDLRFKNCSLSSPFDSPFSTSTPLVNRTKFGEGIYFFNDVAAILWAVVFSARSSPNFTVKVCSFTELSRINL